MAIKGLTDTSSRQDRGILGRIEVKVFKGARKTAKMAGRSLDEKFRIVTANPHIIRILSKFYGRQDENGDFHTENLNVYFPFELPERTFKTEMKNYSASKLERICDREFISMECTQIKDERGNVHNAQNNCHKPCPIAGTQFSVKCPHGCSVQGELFFYIKELFDADLMVASQITCHAYADLTYISDRLEMLSMELGSITSSPFPCFQTRHKIPFILSKTKVSGKRPVFENGKRTGKNAAKEDWMITINPDNEWMERRRAWGLAEQIRSMNLELPPETALHLLQGKIDKLSTVELIEQAVPRKNNGILAGHHQDPSLPLLPTSIENRTITKEEWLELRNQFLTQGWEIKAIERMLFQTYPIERVGELQAEYIPTLKKMSFDEKQKVYWSLEWKQVALFFFSNGWDEEILDIMLNSEFGIPSHNHQELYQIPTAQLHLLKAIAINPTELIKWQGIIANAAF